MNNKYRIEDYLQDGKYPYFSKYKKISSEHRNEVLMFGNEKYFSIMDSYIAKYITDEECNLSKARDNLIKLILAKLELKAYDNIRLPNKCFIREDFETWDYKIDCKQPNVHCFAIMCRVGFLSNVQIDKYKTYIFYETDYPYGDLIKEHKYNEY